MGDPAVQAQAQQLLERGAGLYESGRLYDALACWKQVLDLDPGNEIATEYLRFIEDNFQIGVDAFMAHHEAPSAPPMGVAASHPPPASSHEGSLEEAIGDLDWSEILEDPGATSVPPPVADASLSDEDFFADLEPGSLTAAPGQEADAWGAALPEAPSPPSEADAEGFEGDPLAMDVSAFSVPYDSGERADASTELPMALNDSPADSTLDDELASLPGWLDLSEPGDGGDVDSVPLLSPIQHQPVGPSQRDLTEMSDESIEVMLDRDFKAWEDQDLAELGGRAEGVDDALADLGEHRLAEPSAPVTPQTDLFARPFDRATPPPMPAKPPGEDSLEDWGNLMAASVEVPLESIDVGGPPKPQSDGPGPELPFALPSDQPIVLPDDSSQPIMLADDEFEEVDLDELVSGMPEVPSLQPPPMPADSAERPLPPVSPLAADETPVAVPRFTLGDEFGFDASPPPAPADAPLPEPDLGGGLLDPGGLESFEDDALDLPDFDLSAPPLAGMAEEVLAEAERGATPLAAADDEDPLAMLEAAFDAFEDAGSKAPVAEVEAEDDFDMAGFEADFDDSFAFSPSSDAPKAPEPERRSARSTPPVTPAAAPRVSTPPKTPTPPKGQAAADDLEALLRAGMAEIDAARTPTPEARETPEIRRLITAPSPDTDFDAVMREARRRQQAGDFTGSLELVEQVLAGKPDHGEARGYLEENTTRLLGMYRSRLGRLSKCPKVKLRPQEIIWQSLDHRAGFVLAQVDGMTSYEDIVEISGMGELEATRILARLVRHGVIG